MTCLHACCAARRRLSTGPGTARAPTVTLPSHNISIAKRPGPLHLKRINSCWQQLGPAGYTARAGLALPRHSPRLPPPLCCSYLSAVLLPTMDSVPPPPAPRLLRTHLPAAHSLFICSCSWCMADYPFSTRALGLPFAVAWHFPYHTTTTLTTCAYLPPTHLTCHAYLTTMPARFTTTHLAVCSLDWFGGTPGFCAARFALLGCLLACRRFTTFPTPGRVPAIALSRPGPFLVPIGLPYTRLQVHVTFGPGKNWDITHTSTCIPPHCLCTTLSFLHGILPTTTAHCMYTLPCHPTHPFPLCLYSALPPQTAHCFPPPFCLPHPAWINLPHALPHPHFTSHHTAHHPTPLPLQHVPLHCRLHCTARTHTHHTHTMTPATHAAWDTPQSLTPPCSTLGHQLPIVSQPHHACSCPAPGTPAPQDTACYRRSMLPGRHFCLPATAHLRTPFHTPTRCTWCHWTHPSGPTHTTSNPH